MGRVKRVSWIRRWGKWTGVGLSVLMLSSWLLSYFWSLDASVTRFAVRLRAGASVLNWWESSVDFSWPEFRISRSSRETLLSNEWLPSRLSMNVNPGGYLSVVIIPLWIPIGITALLTVILFYRDRRRCIPPGHCRKCGYDLTGNMSGVCPECGEPASDACVQTPLGSCGNTEDC